MAPFRLNSTAASLLGFLHDGPSSGWELYQTAESRIGDFWSLTRSQVYRELDAMARAGLVEAGPSGPRDRRPFAITPSGRAAFAAWTEQEPGLETIRFPLLLLLGFGEHIPAERLAAHLERHRALHAERLAWYERWHADGEIEPGERARYAGATLAFGIAYERAVLGWFDDLPSILGPTGDERLATSPGTSRSGRAPRSGAR